MEEKEIETSLVLIILNIKQSLILHTHNCFDPDLVL